MTDLVKLFHDKANAINSGPTMLSDLEEILRDSNLAVIAQRPEDAERVLNAAFDKIKESADVWKGLMSFIQSDAALVLADDVMSDKRGIGKFLQAQMHKLTPADKSDFIGFMPMTRAGAKAMKNPRFGAMFMADQGKDNFLALLQAMSRR